MDLMLIMIDVIDLVMGEIDPEHKIPDSAIPVHYKPEVAQLQINLLEQLTLYKKFK